MKFSEGSLRQHASPSSEQHPKGSPKLEVIHGGKGAERELTDDDIITDDYEDLTEAEDVLQPDEEGVTEIPDDEIQILPQGKYRLSEAAKLQRKQESLAVQQMRAQAAKYRTSGEQEHVGRERMKEDRVRALREAEETKARSAQEAQEAFKLTELILERKQKVAELVAENKRMKESIEGLNRETQGMREKMSADAQAHIDRLLADAEKHEAHLEAFRLSEARPEAQAQIELAELERTGALLRNQAGEIIGLRQDHFEVTPGDVLRAAGPAIRKLQTEHTWAQSNLRGNWRQDVMRRLEADVQTWARMSEQAMLEQSIVGNKGVDEKATVANLFYKRPDANAIPVETQEYVERSGAEVLSERYRALGKRRKELMGALEKQRAMYDTVLGAVEGRQQIVDAIEALQEAGRTLEQNYQQKLAELNAKYEAARTALKEGDVDEHGDRIQWNIDRAQASVDRARKTVKVFKGAAKADLEEAEENLMVLKGELNLWRNSDQRKIEMRKRREELEQRASDLYSEIARIELQQQANQGAMQQREYLLNKHSQDFDESTIVEQFEVAQQGFIGAEADLYDVDMQMNAVSDAILRNALEANMQKPANDTTAEAPRAEAAE